MTTNGKPKLTVRMDPELRDAFVQATQHHRDGAAGVVREFIAAYLGSPKARMPRRPKPTAQAEKDAVQGDAPPSPEPGQSGASA